MSLAGSLYDAINYPKNLSNEILSSSRQPVEPRIMQLLQITEVANIFHQKVLSRVGGIPFATTTFYLPSEIGKKIEFNRIAKGLPVSHLVEQALNTSITRAEQTVEPVSASVNLSKLLEIPRGKAILHVLRTYYTDIGKPVEVASVHYRPDQYSLHIELLTNQRRN